MEKTNRLNFSVYGMGGGGRKDTYIEKSFEEIVFAAVVNGPVHDTRLEIEINVLMLILEANTV